MRRAKIFLTALFLLSSTNATSRAQKVGVDAPGTPQDVFRLVNSTRQRKGAAAVDLRGFWKQLDLAPGYFQTCGQDCFADLTSADLDEKPGSEVVLKLNNTNFCRFIVLKRDRKRWKLLGHVDHDFNRYQMARHRVVRFNARPYLIIRGQEGSGSGFSLYSETWYQVGQTGLQSVLSYPVAGHTYPWPAGLGREFEAQAITNSNSKSNLVVRYVVKYIKLDYGKNEQSEFLVNEHRATFQWDKQANTFAFAPSHSNISEAEIEAIANIEDEESTAGTTVGNMKFYSGNETKAWVGGGYEVFLKYNLGTLIKIASDKNSEHREWLRLFLNDCLDTAEKKTLLAALEEGR